MKKIFLKITDFLVAATLLLVVLMVGYQLWPVFAYSGSPISSSIATSCGANQLLMSSDGLIGCVPNTYSLSPSSAPEINIGAYSNYPNPNGIFNTYNEGTGGTPVLAASFMGSTTSYVQLFGQNLLPQGSMDLVFADDKGNATSTTHYADWGIANSLQVDSVHPNINPYDAYFYNQSSSVDIASYAVGASSTINFSTGGAGTTSLQIDQYGRHITSGPKPSLSACGTTPTVSGNDANGTITLGAGISVTGCTMAFSHVYPTGSTVECQTSTNSTLSPSAPITAVSTTGFTVGLTISLAAGKVYYSCDAHQ